MLFAVIFDKEIYVTHNDKPYIRDETGDEENARVVGEYSGLAKSSKGDMCKGHVSPLNIHLQSLEILKRTSGKSDINV